MQILKFFSICPIHKLPTPFVVLQCPLRAMPWLLMNSFVQNGLIHNSPSINHLVRRRRTTKATVACQEAQLECDEDAVSSGGLLRGLQSIHWSTGIMDEERTEREWRHFRNYSQMHLLFLHYLGQRVIWITPLYLQLSSCLGATQIKQVVVSLSPPKTRLI